ncbi:ferroptosis suppressor protein 1-like [Montipora capricornis]|uniref:ferroptosis suppressor protein 1-like n=1 Tax=Montipora capricornis TaxID=246305 RepID=UPI0035F210A9
MGKSSSSLALPKNSCEVVIVGGGYGGIEVAMQLDNYCIVTLIDPKDAFHHNIAGLRCVVEPSFTRKTLIPYAGILRHGSFVKDRVVSCNISRTTVTLASGTEISYDYLVFACGSSVPFPSKVPLGTSSEDAEKLYRECADQVSKSERIAVIGGGAVGLELVGELATDYPSKKVVLLHSREQVLDDRMAPKFLKKINDGLKALKVETFLGEKVNMDDLNFDTDKPWITGPVTLTTDKGTCVETDLVFQCTGMKVNAMAYQSKLSDKMEKNGSLKVDRYLLVEEIENLFAIGDCNNTPEVKEAYTAKLQAGVVVENVKRLNENKSLKEYKPANPAMALTLGRNGGVIQLPNGMVVGNFLTKKFKSKEVMAPDMWKMLKQKMPSNN